MLPALPALSSPAVHARVATTGPSAPHPLVAEIERLASTLAIQPGHRQHFHDLVALLAWQSGQPPLPAEPAPFDAAAATPQVTLDDAVIRHQLAQMASQDTPDGLEMIRLCLTTHGAAALADYAAACGIAPASGFNDWPDATKAAALRSSCLRGADLATLTVDGLFLADIDMRCGSVAAPADARMTLGSLPRANFDNAHLAGILWERGHLHQAQFKGTTLDHVDISLSDAHGAQFTGAQLSDVFLMGNFREADFSGTRGDVVSLGGDFTGADFSHSQLNNVEFLTTRSPDFTGANFDGAQVTLSDGFLKNLQAFPAFDLFDASLPYTTLPKTLDSIADEPLKAGLTRQVLQAFSQWSAIDAAMASSATAPAAFLGALSTTFFAEHAPANDFINAHVLPAMAVTPKVIAPLLTQRADALLRYWSKQVTTAPWSVLAPAQLALQRALHATALLPGNAELRQAWLARPEVAALLNDDAHALIGNHGHVLVLGDVALAYDRGSFSAEFIRKIDERLDSSEASSEPNEVAIFARGADQQVQQQHPRLQDGTTPDVSRWASRVLAKAPLCMPRTSSLDVMFNHRNNDDHSWLRGIDAIEGCDALKIALMAPLINALERSQSHPGVLKEAGMAQSLADVLLENPLYASCPDIADYNTRHLLPVLASYWSHHILGQEEAERRSTRQLARFLTERMPGAAWDEASRLQFAVQQISALTQDAELRRAWQLRDEVAAVVRAMEAMETGLAEISQVLVAGDRRNALAYEDEAFVALLTSDTELWNRVCTLDADPQGDEFTVVPLDNLKARLAPFPHLLSTYRNKVSLIVQKEVIAAIAPPSFAPRFLESLTLNIQTGKLLGDKLQEELMQGFLPHLDENSRKELQTRMWGSFDTTRLDSAHVMNLVEAYRNGCNLVVAKDDTLTPADRLAAAREPLNTAETAALMLGVARVFIEYSSSHRFGREYDSPQALRVYAMALLNEVEALVPALLSSHTDSRGRPALADWKERLQGGGNVFTCTAILSTAVKQVIDKLDAPLQKICSDVYPHAWR